jgi:hypothetical protein
VRKGEEGSIVSFWKVEDAKPTEDLDNDEREEKNAPTTGVLTQEDNLAGLAALNRELIAKAEAIASPPASSA